MQKKVLNGLWILLVVGLFLSKGLTQGWAAERGNLVIFTANWCASCREVIPITREVASQNNLNVSEIDVDSNTAPKQAQNMGLNLPNDELPQVFLVTRGKTKLIFSGKNYKFGYRDAAKAAILQNLQQALPQ